MSPFQRLTAAALPCCTESAAILEELRLACWREVLDMDALACALVARHPDDAQVSGAATRVCSRVFVFRVLVLLFLAFTKRQSAALAYLAECLCLSSWTGFQLNSA